MKKFITITIVSEKDILSESLYWYKVDEDGDGFTHLFDTEKEAKDFLKSEDDEESLIIEINIR